MHYQKKTNAHSKLAKTENQKIIQTLNSMKKIPKVKKEIVSIKIVTDASFMHETHQACCGYYVLINNTEIMHKFKKVIIQSVIEAEAYACILAMNAILSKYPHLLHSKDCYIEWLTDSLINVRNLNNKDDTSLIATLRIIVNQLNFKATHIKGHTYKMDMQEQKMFSEHIHNISLCNEKGFSKLIDKMGKPHLSTEQSVYFAHCIIDKVCGFLNRNN